MPSASAELFLVDYLIRPFGKIYEKMPLVMLFLCLILYGVVAYIVLRSAFMSEHQY